MPERASSYIVTVRWRYLSLTQLSQSAAEFCYFDWLYIVWSANNIRPSSMSFLLKTARPEVSLHFYKALLRYRVYLHGVIYDVQLFQIYTLCLNSTFLANGHTYSSPK